MELPIKRGPSRAELGFRSDRSYSEDGKTILCNIHRERNSRNTKQPQIIWSVVQILGLRSMSSHHLCMDLQYIFLTTLMDNVAGFEWVVMNDPRRTAGICMMN
nr:hypothetical protein Iba_chr10cCG13640 [Ipomoea batatas]